MIYITIGLDARNIYIDNIISKTDKDIFYFDENSFQDFLNEVNTESLFKIPSLLILKNANKIKNIAKILENLNNDNINDIIIDFNTNKLNKEFSSHFSKFKTIEVLDDKKNKELLNKYISHKLNIKGKDVENLIEIIGYNYFSLKNESDKILNYLNGEEFSFEKAKEIIAKNTNFFIFDFTDNILSKKNIEFPIKEHMALFYSLVNDLEIMYKLHCLDLKSSSYNSFKEEIKDIDILKKYSPYYIFKKLKYLKLFTKEQILDLLNQAFETEDRIKRGLLNLEEGIELFILNILK